MALVETTPNLQLLSARTLWADAEPAFGIPHSQSRRRFIER